MLAIIPKNKPTNKIYASIEKPENKNTKKNFWKFKSFLNKENKKEAEILLYGVIGDDGYWDEVTSKEFAEQLKEVEDAETISVRINSPGGDVFAGQAIYSMLKRCKAQIVVYIDGLAASIASLVAMAGDKIIMPKNSMMMIHKPWTISAGNANDMRQQADTLDKVEESMLAAYVEKTGLAEDEIKQLLADETWLTASMALEKGFCDEIEENEVRFEEINCEDADYLIVAFGSAARISEKAIELARNEGMKVGLLRPITLWPFPTKEVAAMAEGKKGVLSVEINAGQMVEDIRLAVNGRVPVEHFGRLGGIVPEPDEIVKALREKF